MKPVTHPLAIALLDAIEASTTNARLSDRAFRARVAWSRAGYPRYADPTPMPAPALGMRVWTHRESDGTMMIGKIDVESTMPDETWTDYIYERDTIDIITDFRTGEVLWRRE